MVTIKKEKIALFALVFVIALIPFVVADVTWSEANTMFQTGSNVMCKLEPTSSFWVSYAVPSISAMDSCYNPHGIGEDGLNKTTCCPTGWDCNLDTKLCVKVNDEQGNLTCGSYKTEDACRMHSGGANLPENIKKYIEERNADYIRRLIQSVDSSFGNNVARFCHEDFQKHWEKNGKGITFKECGCVWNSTDCLETFKYINETSGTPTTTVVTFECQTNSKELQNNCDAADETDRMMTLEWTAKLVDSKGVIHAPTDACKDGIKEFPCPPKIDNPKSLLPFFGTLGFILASSIIIGVYVFLRKRKD
ncbi:MAG: hypothetical protein WC796_05560 [Candidatus Pacearchaeota archaeon]|jgi:hypothetical protein